MAEKPLIDALVEAGGRHDQEQAPETITLAQVRDWCAREERVLRLQHPPDRRLEPADEAELERLDPATMTGALRRWAYLKHLYRRRSERLVRVASDDAGAREAARQLLRREPVRVDLGGRVASVTSRSYAAMHEIARCSARIRSLEIDLTRAAELVARAEAGLRGAPRSPRLRRRLQRLSAVQVRIHREFQLYRQALYAHALTPSGAPARSIDEAPDWWLEIDPAADALLLLACFEAGPGRYARLGATSAVAEKGKEAGEDFGWASLLASIERQQKAEPGEYFDRDLYQLLAWIRAGAPPAPAELDG